MLHGPGDDLGVQLSGVWIVVYILGSLGGELEGLWAVSVVFICCGIVLSVVMYPMFSSVVLCRLFLSVVLSAVSIRREGEGDGRRDKGCGFLLILATPF